MKLVPDSEIAAKSSNNEITYISPTKIDILDEYLSNGFIKQKTQDILKLLGFDKN